MGKPRVRIRAKAPRERSCEGKQKFATLDAAEAAALRPRRMLASAGFMKAYKCRYCDSYHYGHPIKSTR